MNVAPPIRRATPDDAAGIARVQIDGWRRAYRGLLPGRVLADLSLPELTVTWASILRGEAGVPGSTNLVAVDDDGVCGFVCRGPVRIERGEAADATVEVFALYVSPGHLGTGLGRSLMRAALAGMWEDGHRTAVLWVLRGNMRARRFYERGGWRPDGAERASEDGLGLPSVRYRIQIPGTSRGSEDLRISRDPPTFSGSPNRA